MEVKERVAGIDRKLGISLLWVVVMINMIYADILSFMMPGALQEIMTGMVDGVKVTQELFLIFAGLIELPIAMIFLSRVLGRGANRIANIVTSVVTITFVVGGHSDYLHYYFFAGVEVICMLVIIWWSLKWHKLARSPDARENAHV